MRKRTKAGIVTAVALTAGAVGGGVAVAGSDDDEATERPITGAALAKASQAALAYAGGGRVTGTEVGDEDSYYEVEVTRPDGGQTDVQLDEEFHVVSSETDVEDGD